MFSALRNESRRRLLATPFPEPWLVHLDKNVALYGRLTEEERSFLRDDLRIFVTEKNWEGCGGLTITDEIKVTVAAQACLLLLGLDHDYFSRVLSVLIYPSAFRKPLDESFGDDILDNDAGGRLGEAWYRGPVILAWDAVISDGRNLTTGRNIVLHEFAHQLDFLDGLANGTPPLRNREQYVQWHRIMTAEYGKLIRDSKKGRATLLHVYGITDPCEFFAVATECFFTQPEQMLKRHRLLYNTLREYYGQDTAARVTPV